MFICSLKPKTLFKRLLFLAAVAVVVLLLITALGSVFSKEESFPAPTQSENHNTAVPDNAARIAFLQSFGWEVSQEPIETAQVVVPQTFGDVYQNYNDIQLKQGFDLTKFQGKQISRFTYSVSNYPGQKEYIRANLLVYEEQVIGGDICSVYARNGFMHGFVYPDQTETQAESTSDI